MSIAVGCNSFSEPPAQPQIENKLLSAFSDLNGKELHTRLAGIHQMEVLAAQSDMLRNQIKDRVAAFIKDRQSLSLTKPGSRPIDGQKSFGPDQARLPDDIQAALVFLAKPSPQKNGIRQYVIVLRKTDLSGAYLRDGDLEGAILSDSLLNSADLSGANMQRADLKRAVLQKANLTKANFQGAFLWQVDLHNAMLRQANFRKAKLWAAIFRNACMVEADLEEADMGSVNLQEANLEQAKLRNADLGRSNLRHTNLQNSDLTGAFLGWADMRGAFLTDANLNNANLRAADMTQATGLKAKQLCRSLTLYQARLDESLESQIWQMCPHTLRKPRG
jgi:uncharacterized protein YjbI with pentapeptide repeats